MPDWYFLLSFTYFFIKFVSHFHFNLEINLRLRNLNETFSDSRD